MRQFVIVVQLDLDVLNVAAAFHDPFRNRKTDRERFQISRRAHHHRVRNAVEDERHRPLLTDMIGDGFDRCAAVPVHLTLHGARLPGCFQFVQAASLLSCCARFCGLQLLPGGATQHQTVPLLRE